jgi:two-component system, NtrC family, sensor kinase
VSTATGTAAEALHVLVIGHASAREPALAELRPALSDVARVSGAADSASALDAVPMTDRVAMVLLATVDEPGAPATDVDGRIDDLVADARAHAACIVLLTARTVHDDVHRSLDEDRLQAVIPVPWAPGNLAWHSRSQLARWIRERDEDDGRLRSLTGGGRPVEQPSGELLRDLELDESAITRRLLDGIDEALGRRPRLHLPRGTRLTQQDVAVNGVVVVIRGSVALDRSTEVGELRLHHASTGPVVGLLSLAQQRRAFFTARATTDVEVVHLSLEQLDLALRTRPDLSDALAAVSVRALAQRLRRSEQLQVERIQLNRELEAERVRLADALALLEEARLELVESARFASLGELAAGVAHELNNPVAALTRAAAYVADDLARLLQDHPRGDALASALAAGRSAPARSTAEQRAIRRRMAEAVGDATLGDRLIAAGIDDPRDGRRLASELGSEELGLLATANQLGVAVRNLGVAGDRIAELVGSLRAYARPSSEPVEGIDVHAGIEDTLRLVAHELEGIEIEREYGALPAIRCYPGQLSQVWSNLLTNAAESLEGHGSIRIRTDVPDGGQVRVRITDDGPGIDPVLLPRLFEPRFTTKQGTVRYGLGLGLAIAKRVVEAHGGRVELTSVPGETTASVVLPVTGPPDDEPESADRREAS